jgi:hypothetical protein
VSCEENSSEVFLDSFTLLTSGPAVPRMLMEFFNPTRNQITQIVNLLVLTFSVFFLLPCIVNGAKCYVVIAAAIALKCSSVTLTLKDFLMF